MKRFQTPFICDICKEVRGGTQNIDHSKCSEIRKAKGGYKERKGPGEPLSKKQIDYLVELNKRPG